MNDKTEEDDNHVAFESWLRERFQCRSHDMLRNPKDKTLYNDPALQFAFEAYKEGLEAGGFGFFEPPHRER